MPRRKEPFTTSAQCGAVTYDRFRSEIVPTFDEAYVEMFHESEDYAARGDYSKPADRRAVLGRMREYKQTAWDAFQDECAQWEQQQEMDVYDNPRRARAHRGRRRRRPNPADPWGSIEPLPHELDVYRFKKRKPTKAEGTDQWRSVTTVSVGRWSCVFLEDAGSDARSPDYFLYVGNARNNYGMWWLVSNDETRLPSGGKGWAFYPDRDSEAGYELAGSIEVYAFAFNAWGRHRALARVAHLLKSAGVTAKGPKSVSVND